METHTVFRRKGACLCALFPQAAIVTALLLPFSVPARAMEELPGKATVISSTRMTHMNRDFRDLDTPEGIESELEIEHESRNVFFDGDGEVEEEEEEEEAITSPDPSRRRQSLTTVSLELLGGYRFGTLAQGKLAVKFSATRTDDSPETQVQDNAEGELSQFWLQTQIPARIPSWLRLGRHEISEPSTFWWDENVDGLTWQGCPDSLSCTVGFWTLPRSLVSDRDAPDPNTEDLWWLGGSAHVRLREENTLTGYALLRTDQSPGYGQDASIAEDQFDADDSNLAWIGLHSERHQLFPHFGSFTLQAHGALMAGSRIRYSIDDTNESEATDDPQDPPGTDNPGDETIPVQRQKYAIDGWAVDTRLHWQPQADSTWQITLGLAIASGSRSADKPGSGTFMQSGLHSNDPAYPRYGYLYDPELSNIQIVTLALAMRTGLPGYLHLQHNRYWRYSGTDTMLETDFDIDPDDSRRSLGHESGLGYFMELESGIAVELFAARFTAGRAYGGLQRRHVDQWKLQLTYEF